MNPAERDQAVVNSASESFANGCSYLEHFMGAGPLAVADEPTLADCSMATYLSLMSGAVLPAFPDIADPLKSAGKLGTWWQAVSSNDVLKPMIQQYQAAVDDFVRMLRARAAG
jgi:glutathione S-transferase